ncbi:serine/threonine-protein phosphatase with EF-hands 2-like [Anneissia japonica]|uniref:serine/threonine-protein phosphatase with EF-hands 2-like n=1 Tax=Anneissia japonica TaxID=1529436 RepID=UPI001425B1BE|nr:serine/threonine-protein phosphatase with EF-hands 2-like [Anneissia japonica]
MFVFQKVLTVFSASNYYEIGSNRGAYIKLGQDLKPHPVQYMYVETTSTKPLTARQSLSVIEESALRNVREKVTANKSTLREAFNTYDPNETGRPTAVLGLVTRDWVGLLQFLALLHVIG